MCVCVCIYIVHKLAIVSFEVSARLVSSCNQLVYSARLIVSCEQLFYFVVCKDHPVITSNNRMKGYIQHPYPPLKQPFAERMRF